MDYDYDHLGEGISKLLDALRPIAARAQLADVSSDTAWLIESDDLFETVMCFPEAHEMGTIERVGKAVNIVSRLRGLDDMVASYHTRQCLAYDLESHISEECEAQERYMGVHVPFEVRYPENSPTNSPVP